MKGNSVKAKLVEQGISLTEIANELNLEISTVSAVVSGLRSSRPVAEHIASRLDMPLEKVFPKYRKAIT